MEGIRLIFSDGKEDIMTDQKKVLEIIEKIIRKIEEEKEYLTELDQPIGDSDHGINMARGFQEVEKKMPSLEGKDIGSVLKTVGMTLMSKVGGASGPLYGSAFMKAGMAMAGKTEMDIHDFLTCLDTAIAAVQKLGKAEVGEATMIDAMVPADEAMKKALESGAGAKAVLEAGTKASWAGAEHTKELVATKGRASYVGERGIGHQDPGATSFSFILEVISEAV